MDYDDNTNNESVAPSIVAPSLGPPPIFTKEDLRRTNSASSVLGLNVLLYQNPDEYWRPPNWKGIVKDTFVGFKVMNYNPIYGRWR